MAREKAQAGHQKLNTALSIGATLLGAFLGRSIKSVGNVGRAATAARSASRIGKETADVVRAEENVAVLQARLDTLHEQFNADVSALQAPLTSASLDLQKRTIRPRKSDIAVGSIALCWTPWRRMADGTLEPV